MQLAMLDNHVWDLVVDGELGLSKELLHDSYREGQFGIVSTVVGFEEVMGLARRKPKRYRLIARALIQATGPRVLLPLDERHRAEVELGGPLPEPSRYLSKQRMKALRAFARKTPSAAMVDEDVYELKQRRLVDALVARDSVDGRLAAVGLDPRTSVGAWDVHAEAEDWVRDILRAGAAGGKHRAVRADEVVSIETCPSTWLLTVCSMLQAKRRHAEGLKVQDSDPQDADYVSAGTYYEIFVTRDTRLRGTLAAVPSLPFVIMEPGEFAATLAAALH